MSLSQVVALKAHFLKVAQRMAELPIYNTALSVEMLAFQPYAEGEIGVLLTPWCMNLIWLPAESDEWADWREAEVGSKRMVALPSGQYEFIFAWEETVGGYFSCSLFSPMFEFEAQQAALDTAEEVMNALFDQDNLSLTDRQIAMRGQQADAEQPQETPAEAVKVSRRGFLTVGLSRGTDRSVEQEHPTQ